MLEQGGQSGILKIETMYETGSFTIAEQCIFDAEFGSLRDNDAVFHFLKQNRGKFEFQPKQMSNLDYDFHKSITSLLMEGCRIMDEENA